MAFGHDPGSKRSVFIGNHRRDGPQPLAARIWRRILQLPDSTLAGDGIRRRD